MEKTEVGIQAEAKAKAQMKEICSLNKIGKARLEEQEHQTSVSFYTLFCRSWGSEIGQYKQRGGNTEKCAGRPDQT